MIALFDIGNTHTHIGLANARKIVRHGDVRTQDWVSGEAEAAAKPLLVRKGTKSTNPEGKVAVTGAILCSVVPLVTPMVCAFVKKMWNLPCLELTAQTVRGVGIDYPQPKTIGPDRLANAVAARCHFGAPSVVVDFGTAVTFDIVDRQGNYIGGVIAPGLNVMTDYLHEKTALLPRIEIREVPTVVGKNTEQAMLIGAVHGYRGLIHQVLGELKKELRCRRLPVVATGGYARLMAAKLPEITAVEPLLTLEGLRLVWEAHAAGKRGK
jgi:type III pantothenate kinase